MLDNVKVENEEWQARNLHLMNDLREMDIDNLSDMPSGELVRGHNNGLIIKTLIDNLEYAPTEDDKRTYIILIGGKSPYNAEKLINLYYTTNNEYIKLDIISTLTQTRPIDISSWFRHMLSDPTEDHHHRAIIAALIRFSDNPKQYQSLLLEHYDDLHGSPLDTLSKIGDISIIEFLKSKRGKQYCRSDADYSLYNRSLSEVVALEQKKLEHVIAKLELKATKMAERMTKGTDSSQ